MLPHRSWFFIGAVVTVINVFAFILAFGGRFRFTIFIFLAHLLIRYPFACSLRNLVTIVWRWGGIWRVWVWWIQWWWIITWRERTAWVATRRIWAGRMWRARVIIGGWGGTWGSHYRWRFLVFVFTLTKYSFDDVQFCIPKFFAQV